MLGYTPDVRPTPVNNALRDEPGEPEAGANSKVTVVMILSNANPSVGGTERQALILADALQAQEVGVFFLMKGLAESKRRSPAGASRYYGTVKITPLPTLRQYPAWSFLGTFLVWALRHCRYFQIIHAHTAGLGVIASIVGWLTRKKVIVKIPSEKDVQYLRRGGPFRNLRRWVLKRQTSRFVAVSTEMGRSLVGVGIEAGRIALIPNGIAIAVAKSSDDRSSLKAAMLGISEIQVVLFVGRLVEEKGVDRLLTVWAALPSHERSRLLIAGSGPLRAELESMARELDLLSSVQFLGHQPDVSKLYAVADLFVLPSRTEGMSNALLEAMAAGVTPIASAVGGNKDVIEDQRNGFLVDWEDTAACVRLLITLLDDPARRKHVGEAARDRVRAFNLSQIASRYQQLYRAVLGE